MVGSAESNLKTADIYLQKKDLRLIPQFLSALDQAQKKVRLNRGVSIFYNMTAMSLVFAGWIGPVICAIAMPLSSLSVYWIAHRTKYFRKENSPL